MTSAEASASAERSVNHHLHAAGFIEKTLEHNVFTARNHAERRVLCGYVANRLNRAPAIGSAQVVSTCFLPGFTLRKVWSSV